MQTEIKQKIRRILIFIIVLLCLACSGCRDVNSYSTFTLKEGTVHFSLEYRNYFSIKEWKPWENKPNDIMGLTLVSPKIKGTGYYTHIDVLASKPDYLIPDAKSAIELAERNAASWADYKLLAKYELTTDGVQAYRIDYQNQNIIPAIAGIGGPGIEVVREVRFDAKGFGWMIQMTSDSSTAEADKADFEYILQTFKILD